MLYQALKYSFANKNEKFFDFFLKKYQKFQIHNFFLDLQIAKYCIDNPFVYFADKKEKKRLLDLYKKNLLAKKEDFQLGEWLIFPWNKVIYHLINHQDYLDLLSNRNRNLITSEEQKKLSNSKICLAGLSVGSNIFISLVRAGIGNYFKIADFDTVEAHNLNRAYFTLNDLNKEKTEIIKDKAFTINPYLIIDVWKRGLNVKQVDRFVKDCDLIIDAFDHFETKIALRKAAKKYKKPIISGWDLSNGAVLIVERYDLEPNLDLKLFLNNNKEADILAEFKNIKSKTNTFIKIIGKENHDKKMLQSVYQVGKTLTSYPQTIIATNFTSSLFTIATINVLLGRKKYSIRKYINLDNIIKK